MRFLILLNYNFSLQSSLVCCPPSERTACELKATGDEGLITLLSVATALHRRCGRGRLYSRYIGRCIRLYRLWNKHITVHMFNFYFYHCWSVTKEINDNMIFTYKLSLSCITLFNTWTLKTVIKCTSTILKIFFMSISDISFT